MNWDKREIKSLFSFILIGVLVSVSTQGAPGLEGAP